MKILPISAALLVACTLGACASDTSPNEDRGDNPTPTLPGPGGEQAKFTAAGEDYYQLEVQVAGGDWVYLDLDTQSQVFPLDPAASDEWDVAHKGSDIKLNGGVSGAPPSGHDVVIHADKVAQDKVYPWQTVEGAPPRDVVEYHSDEAGDGQSQGNPNNPQSKPAYAFSSRPQADVTPNPMDGAGDYGWYHYSGHRAGSKISVRRNVAYILRTVECGYISLRLTDYTGSQLEYDLKPVDGPACSQDSGGVAALGKAIFDSSGAATQVQVDAADENAWVYLDLINALQVQPAQAADEASWDIALQRSDIKLNGGSSGSQNAALHDILQGDWAIASVPTQAVFHADESDALAFVTYPPAQVQPSAACGNMNGDFGWYYYSAFCNDGQGIHHISPRDVVYIVRARDGQFFKLRLLGYYDDQGQAAQLRLEYAPVSG